MVNLKPKSALYPGYNTGQFGAHTDHRLMLCERCGLYMFNLVVFDHQAVDDVLQVKLKIGLPGISKAVSNDNNTILWIGANRYLIVSTSNNVYDELTRVLPDASGAVQDLSSARTVIRLHGQYARQVMAKGLAIDLSPSVFQSDQVILSSFDHHYASIIHNVSDQRDKFDIYITRSFALSFWHWLTDSALEFGYSVEEPENNG